MSRVSVNTSYSDSSCPGAVLVASSLDMSATTDPANSDSKAISIRVNLTQGGTYLSLQTENWISLADFCAVVMIFNV